jgi:hypothetical protein
MKVFRLAFLIFLAIISCKEKEDFDPIEEIDQIKISDDIAVFIEVEIPGNKSKDEFLLLDNKNRQLPLVNLKNIKAEENTIVTLINKTTNNIVYVGYITKSNIRDANIPSNELRIKNSCENTNIIGPKSSAKFMLANVLFPISVFHVRNFENNSFKELILSNITCNTFTQEQILKIENTIKIFAEEGKDIAETITSTTIKTIIEPITGGLFSDCWEIGSNLLFNGSIELEAHPNQDLTNSLILYNKNNTFVPSSIDSFINVLPNGIIIKDAIKKENGNWKIKFDAYNSLPIPLAVRLGKLKEGTQFQVEPANDVTDYFIKANGSSTIQMIKNGITCEGFINNAFDSYYSINSEGLAIRSSKFDKIEVELEFNPKNNYILFQGPNENDRLRIYHILESLSNLFDLIQVTNEKENIYIELINEFITDSDVISLLKTNSPNLKDMQKIIGRKVYTYIKNSVVNESNSELAKLLAKNAITKPSVLQNLSLVNIALSSIDNINLLAAQSKIDDYTRTVKDYELFIPIDGQSNGIEPVFNPIPANLAVSVAKNGNFSFEKGQNTPSNVKYTVLVDTNENLQNAEIIISTELTLPYVNLLPNTKYYWKVKTISQNDSILANSPVWSFTTITNSISIEPAFNPQPTLSAENIPLNGQLTFSQGINTPEDAIYRLLFDTKSNPTTTYELGTNRKYNYTDLEKNTKYYWKIETIDFLGSVVSTSDIWNFSTTTENTNGTYEGDVTISNQEEVNTFGSNNFTSIIGNLTILNGIDIIDLTPLKELTTISESLRIGGNLILKDLNGLNNLSSVLHIGIAANESLINIDALSNISKIGQDNTLYTFQINNNPNLLNVDGLSGLTYIPGFANITDNKSLNSLKGLSGITQIEQGLDIKSNPSLTNLSGLQMTKGQVSISYNDGLISLAGLENLISISDLDIVGNASLTTLNGINNLQKVEGNLNIGNNLKLTNFCSIRLLVISDNITGKYSASGNLFNPSEGDMKNNKCSQ